MQQCNNLLCPKKFYIQNVATDESTKFDTTAITEPNITTRCIIRPVQQSKKTSKIDTTSVIEYNITK